MVEEGQVSRCATDGSCQRGGWRLCGAPQPGDRSLREAWGHWPGPAGRLVRSVLVSGWLSEDDQEVNGSED